MGLASNRGVPQVRQDRRRGDGQLPSARRRVDLRHAGAPLAGVQHAVSPGGRPGELRLGRRRHAGGDALHRGAPAGAGRRPDGRPREGDGRLRPELRRDHRRADGAAGADSEPAGERLVGHRRRHGDQRPAAQPDRGHRRGHLRHRRAAEGTPAGRAAGAPAEAGERATTPRGATAAPVPHRHRARLPHRRHHRRPLGHRAGLPRGPRLDHRAVAHRRRDVEEGRSVSRSSSPRFRTRSTRSG